ncbi:MAG: PHB depolymerase family esterase [Proteobacteria bacterium]|nr:PHB depolymerase family esterase [Pseudomonadota bacterium]
MPGLEETTAMLARLRRRTESFATAGGDAGEGRMTEVARFGANAGALRLLSYVPEGLQPGAPLVVVLHGCTQRAEPHAAAGGWLQLADRYGFAVIAPEQTPANNPNRCFNWYEPGDQARGRGEAASIRAMVAHAVREHRLDAGRVFVTGLSAGGAMTAVMLATYPEVFAAGGIVAGLPFGVAADLQAALGAMYDGRTRSSTELGERVRRAAPRGGRVPRLAIWHGDADGTVKPHNAGEIAKQWAAAHGLPVEPTQTERLPGRTRAVWRSPSTGEVLIESHLLRGLGHGTPLATRGAEGVGTAAPYMLEAGVSSSLEIARFWGIAGEASRVERAATRPAPEPPRPAANDARPGLAAAVGDRVMASVSGHVPSGVQDVIAQALKSAGLMR